MAGSNADVSIDGGVRLHLEVVIPPSEIATWQPQRIQAFFAGITMVMLAKRTEDAIADWKEHSADIQKVIDHLTAKVAAAKRTETPEARDGE